MPWAATAYTAPMGGRAAAAVGLWAFLLTGALVWVPGYWYDEAVSVTLATTPWPDFVSVLGQADAVHGFYYLLLRPWLALAGTSPLAARLPSVLAVAATSVLLLRCGTDLFDRRAGVVAAVLFPALPAAMWMAGEARSYATAGLVVTLLLLATLRALRAADRATAWLPVALLSATARRVSSASRPRAACQMRAAVPSSTLIGPPGNRPR